MKLLSWSVTRNVRHAKGSRYKRGAACASHCFKTAEVFRVADQWKIKTSTLINYQVSIFSKAYVSLILLIMKLLNELVKRVSACRAC